MIGSIHLLDLLLVLLVVASMILGLVKGFTRELFSLGFLVLGAALAYRFHPQVALSLKRLIENQTVRQATAFLVILIGVIIVGAVITWLIKRVLIHGPLKTIDRMMGMGLGLIRGLLIGMAISILFYAYPIDQEWLDRSRLAPRFCMSIAVVARVLPERLRKPVEDMVHDIQQKNQRNRRTV